jgi:hypothetical protein
MKQHAATFIVLLLSLLTACDKEPTNRVLRFEPPSLAACTTPSEVTVKWDIRSEYPNVQVIQIYVSGDVAENLFAEGNAWGEAKTGPWVRSGTKFIVKDKANGKVLSMAAVKGPSCP